MAREPTSRRCSAGLDSVQKFAGSLPTPDAKVVDEVVDSYFHVAEQVLAAQRQFTKGMFAVAASVAANGMAPAQGAAKDAAGAKKS